MSRPASGRSLGIVVGLAAEARIARRLGSTIAIGGGTPEGARQAVLLVAESGARALLSFGLAGGLDPKLHAGDVLVPDAVAVGGRLIRTDPELSRLLGGGPPQVLLGGERIVADPLEKLALWRATGCAAVDLESAAVAAAAVERSLPFAILRAVCDPAGRAIPAAALAALQANGVVALGRVLASLARRPGQLGALLGLGRDALRARRALLRRVAWIAAQGVLAATSR